MNPGFGGIHPEPMAHFLQALVAAMQTHHADVGLATDGDADRIKDDGCAGQLRRPSSHLHLGPALSCGAAWVDGIRWCAPFPRHAWWTGWRGTSSCLHETPVGFSYIADYMLKGDVLMGGEESGGLSIKGHIPEGDGILMGLLLLEVMAYAKAPLHELVAEVQQAFGPAVYVPAAISLCVVRWPRPRWSRGSRSRSWGLPANLSSRSARWMGSNTCSPR